MESNVKFLDAMHEVWNSLPMGGNITFPLFQQRVAEKLELKVDQLKTDQMRKTSTFLNNHNRRGLSKKVPSPTRGGAVTFIKLQNSNKRANPYRVNEVRMLINSVAPNQLLTVKQYMDKYKEMFKKEIPKALMGRYLNNLYTAGLLDSARKPRERGVHGGSTEKIYSRRTEIDKTKLPEMIRPSKNVNVKPLDNQTLEKLGKRSDPTKNKLRELLKQGNLDINKRLPKGSYNKFAETLNVSRYVIGCMIREIRKENHSKVEKNESPTQDREIQNHLLRNNIVRNSNQEGVVCKRINQTIQNILPQGGAAMIIGTSAPFCASTYSNNNQIITDNLSVAITLDLTTDEPVTIIVGNAVNPEKAKLKASHWQSINYPNDLIVKVDRVDRDGFMMYVTSFVENHKDVPCKVILLTSGLWNFTNSTKIRFMRAGIKGDFNFESPSKFLTSRYKNLHILAMTLGVEGSFRFSIRHLHNGKDEVINIKEAP